MIHSNDRIAGRHRRHRSRFVPLVWATSIVAALVLTLGVNGTLSNWTSAVINTNIAATAVILRETSGSFTCNSSDGAHMTVNSSTHTTINKYGGDIAGPMMRDGSRATGATFKNVGGADASSFTLTPGTCRSLPGTGTPPPDNLCSTASDFTTKIERPTGTVLYGLGTPITSSLTIGTGLAAGASESCTITAAAPPGDSARAQGVTVSQPLTWTLTQ